VPAAGPDLSGIPDNDRRSLEQVCNSDRVLRGPVAYNNCLREQLAAYLGQR
jgi:hypothetical protein